MKENGPKNRPKTTQKQAKTTKNGPKRGWKKDPANHPSAPNNHHPKRPPTMVTNVSLRGATKQLPSPNRKRQEPHAITHPTSPPAYSPQSVASLVQPPLVAFLAISLGWARDTRSTPLCRYVPASCPTIFYGRANHSTSNLRPNSSRPAKQPASHMVRATSSGKGSPWSRRETDWGVWKSEGGVRHTLAPSGMSRGGLRPAASD